ncbi:MAG: hypothetical protein LBD04_04495, partial [Synergistaceae bacterium]|nr:hypothetical protein [Synergistaceae bacterium]
TSERDPALRHMDKPDTIYPDAKKLLIFDRGYPSADMIARSGDRDSHHRPVRAAGGVFSQAVFHALARRNKV